MQGFTLENPNISNATSFLVDFDGDPTPNLFDKALIGAYKASKGSQRGTEGRKNNWSRLLEATN